MARSSSSFLSAAMLTTIVLLGISFLKEEGVSGANNAGVGTAVAPVAVPKEKSCRAVFSDLNKLQIRLISTCTYKLGYKTPKEKLNKSLCILKCVLQTSKLINANGTVSSDMYESYIAQHFPPTLRPLAHTKFDPCLLELPQNMLTSTSTQTSPATTIPAANTSPSDEFCKSHEAFIKCMTRSFVKLCNRT